VSADPSGEPRTSAVRWLSDRVRLILAPNPSPMTLEGTNTYLVGDANGLIVIDPGPNDDGHLASIEAATKDQNLIGVLLTHHHIDHDEVAQRAAERLKTTIAASVVAQRPGEMQITDGERFGGDGVFLTAVATPGHSSDHLCFVFDEENALFTGDHILGRGTTVVAFPDGDMGAYMASLERVKQLGAQRFYPGHGPMIDAPEPVVTEYIEHRKMRERQVIDGLSEGPATVEELVARIYADVDPVLHPVAAMSVRAHLAQLAQAGRAVQDGDLWRRT
jgi:glyoxylase-like metal-dependent hydrolase (beta-lactamase superfamily II)